MGEIRVSYEGQVAILTIDNPPSNCITTSMFRQLGDHVQAIDINREVRAAVILGAGRSLYTVGADIHEMDVQAQLADRKATVLHWLEGCNASITRIEQSRVPFICAMKGISFGAGLEIAFSTLCGQVTTGKELEANLDGFGTRPDNFRERIRGIRKAGEQ